VTLETIFGPGTLLGDEPALMIAGERRVLTDVVSTPVINPATGGVIAEVPHASEETVDEAVTRAAVAQRAWARRTHQERAEILARARDLIELHSEEIARIVTLEQGKPLEHARGEMQAAQNFFDFAVSQKYRNIGEMVATESGEQLLVREEPIGVVAAILPWNFPAAIFCRKVAPALMAGNAIVVKPAELTPLSALALAQVLDAAGLPAGLLSVVCGPGRETGSRLIDHPSVGMVTMTGSTRGGREILARAADKIIPVSLELGGKAPFIVFADANLEQAAKDAVEARMWNAGQVCTCNEITYVDESIYDEFAALVARHVAAITPDDPLVDGSPMGPLVSERERDKVEAMVKEAVQQGATVRVGGGRPGGAQFEAGSWFQPTMLTGVTSDMTIASTEVFGPVLSLASFHDYDDLIAKANSTPFGLSAYVYSSNLHTVMRVIDDLEFGEIYVNKAGPERQQGFHTGWKASGLGGDDGAHGYERYLRRKTTYVGYGPAYGQ